MENIDADISCFDMLKEGGITLALYSFKQS